MIILYINNYKDVYIKHYTDVVQNLLKHFKPLCCSLNFVQFDLELYTLKQYIFNFQPVTCLYSHTQADLVTENILHKKQFSSVVLVTMCIHTAGANLIFSLLPI